MNATIQAEMDEKGKAHVHMEGKPMMVHLLMQKMLEKFTEDMFQHGAKTWQVRTILVDINQPAVDLVLDAEAGNEGK